MNYPSKEQRDEFVRDLKRIIQKHGVGLRLDGYEYEIDFVPAHQSNIEYHAGRAAFTTPQPEDGWEDVLNYGPPTPYECLSPMDQMGHDILTEMFKKQDAIESFSSHNDSGFVTARYVTGRVRVSKEMLDD